ncbi:hypothetical protein KAU88_02540 [Candidatus Bathyarchaeota archaeon]|nr:hypothetical protein [Candidatus Bathyarchaeota archaeon]
MKIWIGHYSGNPEEWFVVWAKNKDEAFHQIDPISGKPDMGSLKELHAPGFMSFTVQLKGKPEEMLFLPPKQDVEGGYWLVFGGGLGQVEHGFEEHIRARLLSRSE